MSAYHITHTHTAETCFGGPNADEETMGLWKQVKANAHENNVEIQFFQVNATEHTFFLLMEAAKYSDIEKTIGQSKKTGDFVITPVMDPPPALF